MRVRSLVRKDGTFSSLYLRNFRVFLTGQVFSDIGTWMVRVAQDWLVVILSEHDPFVLGLAIAVQFAPVALLSLWAGALADRFDKPRLLMGVQAGMMLQSLLLAALVLTGVAELWHVFAIAFVFGCLAAFELPVRQSLVPEIVGQERLPNAISLSSTVINFGRVVGPAVAGFGIVWVGIGWIFVVHAATATALLIALCLMDPTQLFRGQGVARARGRIREGLAYVTRRRDLTLVITAVFLLSTFSITFWISLAIMASNVFGTDAAGYGFFSTMLFTGTFAGAVVGARRGNRRKYSLDYLLAWALALGVLEFSAGLVPVSAWFGVLLVPVGFASVTILNSANTLVQSMVDPDVRGRVTALYVLALVGGTPIAAILLGWMADAFGGRSPMLFGGGMAVLVAAGLTVIARTRPSPTRRVAPTADPES